ncbi:hypothetical protein [Ruegeria sp.]|uniref:hypothetical protein n=1 Tax=Ruegeria sp. TaxID=1879320 RepID=UPI003C79C297
MAITVDAPVCGEAVAPAFVDGEWHDLPEGWLDTANTASKFLSKVRVKANNPLGNTNHETFLHIRRNKMFATNNENLIEFNIGRCSIQNTSLLASEVRLLKSFGNAPIAACIADDRIRFRFPSGESCEFQNTGFEKKYLAVFKNYWDFNSEKSTSMPWKQAFLDRFEYLRDDDLIEVNPEGFIGSEGDNLFTVHLPAETCCPEKRVFTATSLYAAMSIADEVDFSQEHACYKNPTVRGIIVSRSIR